jgi:hypothetical protein
LSSSQKTCHEISSDLGRCSCQFSICVATEYR